MAKPVVGIIGNAHLVDNRWTAQMVGERNLRAIAEVAGALPLMFAGMPDVTDVDALLDTVDGILLTGARANVHPTRFGEDAHPRYEPYDSDRDGFRIVIAGPLANFLLAFFGLGGCFGDDVGGDRGLRGRS